MEELAVSFSRGNSNLFGVKHSPSNTNNLNQVWIVFLHGWAGYRTGPHDMFVKLARRLSNKGFTCLRFDFGGRGFSQNQSEVNYHTMIADMDTVLKEINSDPTLKRIVLIGICSGAKLGLYYIKNKSINIDHLIELSMPVLQQSSSIKLEVNQMKFIGFEYLEKLFKINTLKKIANNEVNYKKITNIIFLPFKNALVKLFTKQTKKTIQSKLSFSNFHGKILAIHGNKDPEAELAIEQLSELLNKNSIIYDIELIEGANHSFYSIASELIVFEKIEKWLLNLYKVKG